MSFTVMFRPFGIYPFMWMRNDRCPCGANGAGKTTLLKTISGLSMLKEGDTFFGKSLGKLRPQEVVNIGVSHVPEGGVFFLS